MKLLVCLVLLFGITGTGISQVGTIEQIKKQENDRLRKAFIGLGDQTPRKEVHRNAEVLRKGGVNAIFVLVGELENTDLASRSFDTTSKMKRDPVSGKIIGFEQLRIGEVAFDLLQESVEGWMPDSFRRFAALGPDNAKRWLEKRRGKELVELQIDAVEQAITNAKASFKQGENTTNSKALAYFEERKRQLLKNRAISRR